MSILVVTSFLTAKDPVNVTAHAFSENTPWIRKNRVACFLFETNYFLRALD